MDLPFRVPSDIRLETDVSPGSWIDEALRARQHGDEGALVGEVVPEGFEAYARILHPARRRVDDGYEAIRWAELARERGKRVHPEVQLRALLGEEFRDGPPFGELPVEGSLPDELREPLVATLRGFTGTPDRCWLCIWEGYGYWGGGVSLTWSRDGIRAHARQERRRAEAARRILDRIPTVDMMRAGPERIPQRRYFLFRGSVESVIALGIGDNWSQSPNYWWPDDRSWIVVSELDAPCTYVAGPAPLVQALLVHPALEVVPSDPAHRFDWLGDRINSQDGP